MLVLFQALPLDLDYLIVSDREIRPGKGAYTPLPRPRTVSLSFSPPLSSLSLSLSVAH